MGELKTITVLYDNGLKINYPVVTPKTNLSQEDIEQVVKTFCDNVYTDLEDGLGSMTFLSTGNKKIVVNLAKVFSIEFIFE